MYSRCLAIVFWICLLSNQEVPAQGGLYLGTLVGGKYSYSVSRNHSVVPAKVTAVPDLQGGILFGYSQNRIAIEGSILFNTVGFKHVYQTPLIPEGRQFRVLSRRKDYLTIALRGLFAWLVEEGRNFSFGSSLGIALNTVYSKSIALDFINREQSLLTSAGEYILTYDDLLIGNQEWNFSITSGLYGIWEITKTFSLRTEVGFNLGITHLDTRILLANLEYIDNEGANSWQTTGGRSQTFLYSKGDHLFLNLSALIHMSK